MADIAQHTPMMQRGLYRVTMSSIFTNVSQCVSQVGTNRRSTSLYSGAIHPARPFVRLVGRAAIRRPAREDSSGDHSRRKLRLKARSDAFVALLLCQGRNQPTRSRLPSYCESGRGNCWHMSEIRHDRRPSIYQIASDRHSNPSERADD